MGMDGEGVGRPRALRLELVPFALRFFSLRALGGAGSDILLSCVNK